MISLIVLAAGKSTRMKENKLLLKINGETLVEHVVGIAKKSSADEVVVVLGYEAQRVGEQLAKLVHDNEAPFLILLCSLGLMGVRHLILEWQERRERPRTEGAPPPPRKGATIVNDSPVARETRI